MSFASSRHTYSLSSKSKGTDQHAVQPSEEQIKTMSDLQEENRLCHQILLFIVARGIRAIMFCGL